MGPRVGMIPELDSEGGLRQCKGRGESQRVSLKTPGETNMGSPTQAQNPILKSPNSPDLETKSVYTSCLAAKPELV